jgi:hypothetical protein
MSFQPDVHKSRYWYQWQSLLRDPIGIGSFVGNFSQLAKVYGRLL